MSNMSINIILLTGMCLNKFIKCCSILTNPSCVVLDSNPMGLCSFYEYVSRFKLSRSAKA